MRNRKWLVITCVLFLALLILGGVFLYWFLRYRATGLAPLGDLEGEYRFDGKLLRREDGLAALRYIPAGKESYETLPVRMLDLAPYGFTGETFSYFRAVTDLGYGMASINYYPIGEEYEPFWPVCTGDKLVYLAKDGKKYRIEPDKELCYPLFADSVEGVDEYAADVIAFSANASFAIALDGTKVTIYQTDPMDDSLRVVSVSTVSLAEYGASASFGAFVGNKEAYFIMSGGKTDPLYVALNCADGETAASLLDPEGTYGKTVDRLYAERLDGKDKEEEDLRLTWCHLLLGTAHQSAVLNGFREGEILSVSPAGEYAVVRAAGEGGEEILVTNHKRVFSLSKILGEGERFREAAFVYENVIAVSLARADGTLLTRSYKICF